VKLRARRLVIAKRKLAWWARAERRFQRRDLSGGLADLLGGISPKASKSCWAWIALLSTAPPSLTSCTNRSGLKARLRRFLTEDESIELQRLLSLDLKVKARSRNPNYGLSIKRLPRGRNRDRAYDDHLLREEGLWRTVRAQRGYLRVSVGPRLLAAWDSFLPTWQAAKKIRPLGEPWRPEDDERLRTATEQQETKHDAIEFAKPRLDDDHGGGFQIPCRPRQPPSMAALEGFP
jgi:hypothetical protein